MEIIGQRIADIRCEHSPQGERFILTTESGQRLELTPARGGTLNFELTPPTRTNYALHAHCRRRPWQGLP